MFRSKKIKKSQWTDKTAGKIARAGMKLQTTFASAMNKMFSNMPSKKLKILLVTFCLVSGGFSLYLVFASIFGSSKNGSVQIEQITVPKHINRPAGEIDPTDNTIDDETYQEVQHYKHYMDSTGQPIGSGLADSIRMLEQLYHEQKK